MRAGEVGVVVIGRNEGERLKACLAALGAVVQRTVYVDSGSTDGSPAHAAAVGARVVALDMARPFTAARARNAGFARLLADLPDIRLVQFLDGDCTLAPGWLDAAAAFLDAHPDVAVVAGRRRERHPDASLYNLLCDREWDGPAGEARECGGDILARTEAIAAVGGYAGELIAGEEPDMCVRLRAAGWRIWRLADEMSLHDAAITRFTQWWRRSVRTGHAFAEVSARHRASPFGIWKDSVRRTLLWGLILPLVALFGALLVHPAALLLLLLYPLQVGRIARREGGGRMGWAYGLFTVLGKFPELQGVARYYLGRLSGRRTALLEYK